jgi:uncharacterized membrane protein YqiK
VTTGDKFAAVLGAIVMVVIVVAIVGLLVTRRYQRYRVRLTFEVERRDTDPGDMEEEDE